MVTPIIARTKEVVAKDVCVGTPFCLPSVAREVGRQLSWICKAIYFERILSGLLEATYDED